MKIAKIIFIIYIYINQIKSSNNTNPNIAVIPFKTFVYPLKPNNQQFSSKEYMDIIHSSLIYLDIEIGKNINNEKLTQELSSKLINNKQFLSLFIVIDKYDFYISDNYFIDENKKKLCHYSTNLSTSYEIDINDNIKYNMKNAYIASDYFKIYNGKIQNNNNILTKVYFRHSYDNNGGILFSCGAVGLLTPANKLYMETKTNFINQIHENLENVDYSFSIQYNKKDNFEDMDDGILIIGEESIAKKQNTNLVPIYVKQKGYGSNLDWEFELNRICIGNKIIENEDSKILIKSNIDGFQIPYFFYQELNSIFFNKYYSNKICQNEIVNNLYIIISCNSDLFSNEDIKNFPEINFFKYKLGFNFTFTGKELFSKKGNKYFFKMVIYFQQHLKVFYFGRLFMKKYKVIFNSDSKIMYFFDVNENINIMNNDDNPKTNRNNSLLILSYILIGIVFLVVGIFFGRRYCYKKRRLYANELEDDNYIYETKEKNVKNKNKLIDF